MNIQTTKQDTVNDDGSVTRTITTVNIQQLTADQYQKEQDIIQRQIDSLTAQQVTNQSILTQIQAKIASLPISLNPIKIIQ